MSAIMDFVLCIATFPVKVWSFKAKTLKQISNCYVALKYIRRVASSSLTALSVVFAFINAPQGKGLGESK